MERLFDTSFIPLGDKDAPLLKATMSADQTLTAAAGYATLQFDTAGIDTADGFSTSTYTYTIPSDGIYLVVGVLSHTEEITVQVLDGSSAVATIGSSAGGVCPILYMGSFSEDDTIKIQAQDDDATVDAVIDASNSSLAIYKLP